LASKTRRNRAWQWVVGAVAMLSLSGCAMYPTHPGDWPQNAWGDILKAVSAVIDFFSKYTGGSYGVGLLIVTVLVRLLILPLMVRQIRFSKVMQQIQPEMQKLRERYKGDPQKAQEEMMKLYQKYGVNPMAGCLPMLIQLPILYALFGAIEGNPALNSSTFLGIFHLGQPDHYYILPLLAAITTYLSSKVMMTSSDPQQKMMLFIMPVFIFFIGSRFASGLALYWIYSNIFTTVQTYFIRVRPANAASTQGGR
jgi:YidC/Oxa1 family membrane protein insertase